MSAAMKSLGVLALVAAITGCGDTVTNKRVAGPTRAAAATTAPARGVAMIAAQLAPLCVDRIGTSEEGRPATAKVAGLVDEMVEAYTNTPVTAGTTERVRVARDNMLNGCGPEQADKLGAALSDAGTQVEATPSVEPDPDGTSDLQCDYVLGDFGESGNPAKGYRFIGGGTLENTGNVGIRVRVTYSWRQLGSSAVKARRTYKVRRGQTREVNVTVPASNDQIDLHQSAGGKCSATAKIIGAFGRPR